MSTFYMGPLIARPLLDSRHASISGLNGGPVSHGHSLVGDDHSLVGDELHDVLGQAQLRPRQPVLDEEPGQQVPRGDEHLLLERISREADDLHGHETESRSDKRRLN